MKFSKILVCIGMAFGFSNVGMSDGGAAIEFEKAFSDSVKEVRVDGSSILIRGKKGETIVVGLSRTDSLKDGGAFFRDGCLKLALFSKATGSKFVVLKEPQAEGFSFLVDSCTVE